MYRHILVFLVLLLAAPSTVEAYRLFKTPTGAYFHWSGNKTSYVVSSADLHGIPNSDVVDAVHSAFSTWTAVECTNITVTFAGSSGATVPEFRQDGSNQNLISWVNDKQEWQDIGYAPMQIAMTAIMTNSITGEVLDADITVNAAHFEFSLSELPPDGKTDFLNALTHEIGHFMGLDENLDDTEATMYYLAKPGETKKRDLTSDDEEGLFALYPHTDCVTDPAALESDAEPSNGGCSLSPHSSDHPGVAVLLGLVLAMWLLLRQRRTKRRTCL